METLPHEENFSSPETSILAFLAMFPVNSLNDTLSFGNKVTSKERCSQWYLQLMTAQPP